MEYTFEHDYEDLTFEQRKEIRKSIDVLIDRMKTVQCVSCGKHFRVPHVAMYNHSGGFQVAEKMQKQWLSFECTCGYHTSFWKLM